MKTSLFCILIIAFFASCATKKTSTDWTILLEQPGKQEIEIVSIPNDLKDTISFKKKIDGITVSVLAIKKTNYIAFSAKATVNSGESECYLSLCTHYDSQKPWNYNGEVKRTEIFRQSPHDLDAWITDSLAKQPMPVIALKTDNGFTVAVNNSPVYYDNYCTQQFYLDKKELRLSSGDNGKTPGMKPKTMKMANYNAEKGQKFHKGTVTAYYHKISPLKSHLFEGVIIQSKSNDMNNLRKDIILAVADHWSGGKAQGYFGALEFSVPYMNLRVNDSKKSKYWVVPSVEYANTQYCRDAFWISTMLSDTMSAQCLKNELDSVNHYAEYPLYIPIWAYRTKIRGGQVDLVKVQKYIDAIEKHIRNGYYYSFDANDGRWDFQSWNDGTAFDTSDVLTYNQGLLAVCLLSAKEMGLKVKTNPELAIRNYQGMFNKRLGYFPISKMKPQLVIVDAVVPDLLAQVYLNKTLLSKDIVQKHFNQITWHSKTTYGYKITALPDGSYPPAKMYDVGNYISMLNSAKMIDGQYHKGGSWYLYDMLFIIDAYLHDIKGAEDELIWRASLEFKIGATNYECLNTKTGEPWKPNMGWNAAVYTFWKQVVDEKKASNKLFKVIDEIVK